MPNNQANEGTIVAQWKTDAHALNSMTLLVAAVIVHDKATNRVVLLQCGPNVKFAQGKWDLPVGKSEPGEPITETAVRELREETGLIVKPESLRVAHIIHGAWGVEAPQRLPHRRPRRPRMVRRAGEPRAQEARQGLLGRR
jgi:8-oxo-dGTP pyrophosphatase MutT (NUDIX family)